MSRFALPNSSESKVILNLNGSSRRELVRYDFPYVVLHANSLISFHW
jgi:hypothetical protein